MFNINGAPQHALIWKNVILTLGGQTLYEREVQRNVGMFGPAQPNVILYVKKVVVVISRYSIACSKQLGTNYLI